MEPGTVMCCGAWNEVNDPRGKHAHSHTQTVHNAVLSNFLSLLNSALQPKTDCTEDTRQSISMEIHSFSV